ncbi:MAG: DUF1330 domain-containing protein [Opitutaceae bacterium]|nr:DUF1330 domain-containing protein [Opitutaceae bacterium]
MPAYLILNYQIDDEALFREYQKESTETVLAAVSDILVYQPETEILEGENIGHQTIVFTFESMEKAKDFYHSETYQEMTKKRLKATSKHFAVLVPENTTVGK